MSIVKKVRAAKLDAAHKGLLLGSYEITDTELGAVVDQIVDECRNPGDPAYQNPTYVEHKITSGGYKLFGVRLVVVQSSGVHCTGHVDYEPTEK